MSPQFNPSKLQVEHHRRVDELLGVAANPSSPGDELCAACDELVFFVDSIRGHEIRECLCNALVLLSLDEDDRAWIANDLLAWDLYRGHTHDAPYLIRTLLDEAIVREVRAYSAEFLERWLDANRLAERREPVLEALAIFHKETEGDQNIARQALGLPPVPPPHLRN